MDGYEADFFGVPDDGEPRCGDCPSWDGCGCGCGWGLCRLYGEWTAAGDGCD